MNAHRGFTAAGAVVSFALLIAPPLAAKVRLTTATDSGGPASALLACVGPAMAQDNASAASAETDFHAWLFVTAIEGAAAAPHAIHLFLTVDDADAAKRTGQVGIPLSFVSWRSFQGEATDPALCSEIARAIQRGVADAGPGLRSIKRD